MCASKRISRLASPPGWFASGRYSRADYEIWESCILGPKAIMGLQSLINAIMTGALPLIHQLSLWHHLEMARDISNYDQPIGDKQTHDVRGWLSIAKEVASQWGCRSAIDRIEFFERGLARGLTWRALSTEARVLREAFEAGFSGKMVFVYPDEQGSIVRDYKKAWAPALAAFPGIEIDVLAVVDCWALGHGTASVFHAMRVMEWGLEALAAELEVECGAETWGVVIERIEKAINAVRAAPRSEGKAARVRFLSEAATEFRHVKDAWRNYVTHNRAHYDAHTARGVMEHTRSFMNHLAVGLRGQGAT